jgi:hypothetical protein
MPKKITLDELALLACKFDLHLADVQAVYEVETGGSGFLSNGNPKILFERHWFSKFTNGVYDTLHPDISNKTRGGYKGSLGEWSRFDKAKKLNKDAAIKSTSWGAGQIMGFHYKDLGFETPQDFLNQNFKGEYEQFEIMLKFIKNNNSIYLALKNRNWPMFARLYNGPAYRENQYDTKLAAAHAKHLKEIA